MEIAQSKNSKAITYNEPGKFENTRFEKIHNVIFSSAKEGSVKVAKEIRDLILDKQSKGEMCVLGLATGSSPIKVYEELIRIHKEESVSFQNVITFNLDEYYPMERENIHSYHYFMHEHLFNHIDILPKNINIPKGNITADELHDYCIS